MRVVFVENNDSFSWNVIELLPVARSEVRVVGAAAALVAIPEADVLVIGPGPTDPGRAGLVDVVRAAAAHRLPTLGVCLGHQAIGVAFGARLSRTTPCYGKTAVAHFGASRSFPSISGPRVVMRYHALSLAEVGPPLRVVASLDDGTVMAVEHETLPIAGLQFHPDSHATPEGAAMVETFFTRGR